ncbi:MAG: hypothetical protein JJT90_06820, partial [Ectothiorhodospiraceae bacterium]|nr:hypothetical protein [Ectothiorhodospiraceae bacterium]
MDEDLDLMTREELIGEARKLRLGIRRHRDSSRHELCWHHPALWGLLPEKTDPIPVVPEWPEFMRGCIKEALIDSHGALALQRVRGQGAARRQWRALGKRRNAAPGHAAKPRRAGHSRTLS